MSGRAFTGSRPEALCEGLSLRSPTVVRIPPLMPIDVKAHAGEVSGAQGARPPRPPAVAMTALNGLVLGALVLDSFDVHVPVPSGRTGMVLFTPTKPGTYIFYCGDRHHPRCRKAAGRHHRCERSPVDRGTYRRTGRGAGATRQAPG